MKREKYCGHEFPCDSPEEHRAKMYLNETTLFASQKERIYGWLTSVLKREAEMHTKGKAK